MHLVCLGISHKTAPVDVRERFAVEPHLLCERLQEVQRNESLSEAVILSTCNRVEYYLSLPDPISDFTQFLPLLHGGNGHLEPNHLFYKTGETAIRHLFEVSSGLDSMVIGETEILGQVKKAYQTALGESATGKFLNKLFQRAFQVAKEVRSHTHITRGPVSVGSAAVDLAEKIFGELRTRIVLILGAGETSERVARSLQGRGVQSVIVSNRSYPRAKELAESIGGRALLFDQWEEACIESDIVISSTAAPHLVMHADQVRRVMKKRPSRPLFAIDIAVPRDIDPEIERIDGVYLYDIDALQRVAHQAMADRQREVQRCEALIDEHVRAFQAWWNDAVARQQAKAQPSYSLPQSTPETSS